MKSAWNISITVSTTGKRTWRKCDTPGKLRKGANLEVDDIVEEVSGATEERLSPAHILSITHRDFSEILESTHPPFVIGNSALFTPYCQARAIKDSMLGVH